MDSATSGNLSRRARRPPDMFRTAATPMTQTRTSILEHLQVPGFAGHGEISWSKGSDNQRGIRALLSMTPELVRIFPVMGVLAGFLTLNRTRIAGITVIE